MAVVRRVVAALRGSAPYLILAVAGGAFGACGARTGLDDGRPDGSDTATATDGGVACSGVCAAQVKCPGGTQTSLTGTAFLPNGTDPAYDAVVYVPTSPVEPFPMGVQCSACGAPVSGSPLVSARTGPDGSFTLVNAPAGMNVPLVLQLGKWRTQLTVPEVAPCVATAVDPSTTRLPGNQGEGDMPLMALVTGQADAIECALRAYGVDDSEFTGPGSSGHVQMYVDNGATVPGAGESTDLPGELMQYDAVIYDCDGDPGGPNEMQPLIVQYANAGGQVYTTHFGYSILENVPFASTMELAMPPGDGMFSDAIATIPGTTQGGSAFAAWLGAVGALTGQSAIDISLPKDDIVRVLPPSFPWLVTNASSSVGATVQLYTFATPLGVSGSAQCGGVTYASYHVSENGMGSTSPPFPLECESNVAAAQLKAFEFFVFSQRTCAP